MTAEKREPVPICIAVVDDVLWDVNAVAMYLEIKPGSINDMMYRSARKERTTLPEPLAPQLLRSVLAPLANGAVLIELVERFSLRLWSASGIMAYKASRDAEKIVKTAVGE